MERKLATASQPEEIGTNPQAVHLEALVHRVLRSGKQEFGRANAVIADEVGRDRDFGPAFDEVRELGKAFRRVWEELSHAQHGVERTGRFVDLKQTI